MQTDGVANSNLVMSNNPGLSVNAMPPVSFDVGNAYEVREDDSPDGAASWAVACDPGCERVRIPRGDVAKTSCQHRFDQCRLL